VAVTDSSKTVRGLMIGLAGLVLITFLLGAAQWSAWLPGQPAVVHLIFALGIMPLILGAMIYFTPVLTQSRAPERWTVSLPLLALAAGGLGFAGLGWDTRLTPFAALLGIAACTGLLGWMGRRARRMPGSPHPCLHWYRWAVLSLILGLAAILGAALWPEHAHAFKRFHLHANTLGFVGLTAFGTLQVLLPTVANYHKPDTAIRLRRDVYSAVAGTLLIVIGGAVFVPLSWAGLLLWLQPLARFALPLVSTYRKAVWGWHRAGTALAIATFGLALVLLSGALHTAGWQAPELTTRLFFYAFLLPLVTGAISHLLPVWLWPGRDSPYFATASRRLALGSGMRTGLFVLAGVLTLSELAGAQYFAIMGIGVFILQILWALSGSLGQR